MHVQRGQTLYTKPRIAESVGHKPAGQWVGRPLNSYVYEPELFSNTAAGLIPI